ncbi:hypothetical protein CC86DRAFT_469462 [Ophiobolus disseminans]|uniref:Uncharacterized protein n=1 Tax=Ophiobolus disseminans TaxID=1469910 RepID=A0A6A6ZPT1_9PLEO|nr:hypothetical protein CC86DRAFT_469462 [Ophiobolus disseminans]
MKYSYKHVAESTHAETFAQTPCFQLGMSNSPPRVGQVHLDPAIFHLPNEMLDAVASFLVPEEVFALEGLGITFIPSTPGYSCGSGRSASSQQLFNNRYDLRSLALVCRRLRPVAERLLYAHISLPQPPLNDRHRFLPYPLTPLPFLVRTLFDRPELASCVTTLHLWLRDRRLVMQSEEPDLWQGNPHYQTFQRACSLLSSLHTSFEELVNWSTELYQYQEMALHAILISLLPRLKALKLYAPLGHNRMWTWHDPQGRERDVAEVANYSYLDVAIRNSTITSMHVGMPFPIRHFPATSLAKIEFDILFFGDCLDLFDSPGLTVLPQVHTVSVVIHFPLLAHRNLTAIFKKMDPRTGLQVFLRDVVPNIQTFSIDSSCGTLPLYHRGWLLDHQRVEDLKLDEDLQDLEMNPMYNRNTDGNAWDWLLQALRPVKDRLRTLTLPHNWFSSTSNNVKPLRSLSRFTKLEHLSLPNAAIMCDPNGEGYVAEDHETVAVTFLPTSIRSIVLTQVETRTCQWIQTGLEQKNLLSHLAEITLVFQKESEAVLSYGFEKVARHAGVKVTASWRDESMVL